MAADIFETQRRKGSRVFRAKALAASVRLRRAAAAPLRFKAGPATRLDPHYRDSALIS
jgi:hypothetical protein